MYNDDSRKKLQDIISGKHIAWQADTCTAARNFLCSGFSPNTTVKKEFDYQSAVKEEQAKELIAFIDENALCLLQFLTSMAGYLSPLQQQYINFITKHYEHRKSYFGRRLLLGRGRIDTPVWRRCSLPNHQIQNEMILGSPVTF